MELPDIPDLDRLANLIDHPTEEPYVEYKSWIDLSAAEHRSKLAKHLCALANYGGGWIVFGITDDGKYAKPHPTDLICAKSDGPLVDKHRLGVTQGIHYIRTTGPKSVPIDRPELWKEVLHRCVLAERDQLLSSIGRLFEKPAIITEAPLLEEFLDEAITRWNAVQNLNWPVDSVQNKSTVSFQLLNAEGNATGPQAQQD